MKIKIAGIVAVLVVLGAVVLMNVLMPTHTTAQDDTPTPSTYVDLLDTEIRGISPEDINGFRTGAGMGFALPAELNGYPGPRHVLDLAEELELTEDQLEAVEALYDDMLPQAIDLGEQLLRAEADLEIAFREGTIAAEDLQDALAQAEQIRADLRFVHLSTHLATIDILTFHQVRQYSTLRGYGSGDHSGHGGH
ncbi:MAG: hypothetical protein AAF125_00045 [Chloroflexota bacterium]